MTLVNTETGELVEISYADVKRSIEIARESGSTFFEQIVWQIEHQAWTHLGYANWDEMREAEYADMGVVVPRADRPEIAARMRQSGLTQQQVADTIGVSVDTVQRDLKAAPAAFTEPVVNSRGQARPATYSKPDPAFAAKAAADEFPELTYYVDNGRRDEAIRIATALRGYDTTEQKRRLEILRKTVLAEMRRDNPPHVVTAEDENALKAESIFFAANLAAQKVEQNGGAAAIRAAIATADPLELETWRDQFDALARLCDDLAAACQPTLRRIK